MFNIANDVTWKKQTADFYITGGENDIDGNITIEAGSKLMFVNDSYFYFGYYANTKITAVGTSTSRITFTSASTSPVAGSWKGLYFADYTQSNTGLLILRFSIYQECQETCYLYKKPINVGYTNISNFSSTHAAEYKTGITMPTGLGNNFTWTAN
jgi:hypothetical protein